MGRGAGSPSNNVARDEAYLHANFRLDAFNRLATIRQRYRQDRQRGQTDRQRSDSIGRIVLQTVAQKRPRDRNHAHLRSDVHPLVTLDIAYLQWLK